MCTCSTRNAGVRVLSRPVGGDRSRTARPWTTDSLDSPGSHPWSGTELPTLADLMNQVERARADGDAIVKAFEADPDDGHPTLIDIDWLPNAIDDEECYRHRVLSRLRTDDLSRYPAGGSGLPGRRARVDGCRSMEWMTANGASAGAAAPLFTRPFVQLALCELAYFAAAGLTIPITPLFAAGPLGANELWVGITVGAFSLSTILLRPWAGRAVDRRGRRPLLIGGALLCAVTLAAHAVTTTLPVLIALRLVLGVAEAFFFVAAFAALADLAPPGRAGEALSFNSLALYLGIALGPVLGEADARPWRLRGGLAGRCGSRAAGHAPRGRVVRDRPRAHARRAADAPDPLRRDRSRPGDLLRYGCHGRLPRLRGAACRRRGTGGIGRGPAVVRPGGRASAESPSPGCRIASRRPA